VVTGNLTVSGSFTWNGIVLVVGTGSILTDGNATYNGAVVVANTSGGVLGVPTISVNGGGGKGGVNYSSSCIAQVTQQATFHVISIRELMN
jgi:hypothetical protein